MASHIRAPRPVSRMPPTPGMRSPKQPRVSAWPRLIVAANLSDEPTLVRAEIVDLCRGQRPRRVSCREVNGITAVIDSGQWGAVDADNDSHLIRGHRSRTCVLIAGRRHLTYAALHQAAKTVDQFGCFSFGQVLGSVGGPIRARRVG